MPEAGGVVWYGGFTWVADAVGRNGKRGYVLWVMRTFPPDFAQYTEIYLDLKRKDLRQVPTVAWD
jgi:hypothetical protein